MRLVQVLHHVHDKDLFSEVYRESLSKRLLDSGTKLDEDAERVLLRELKSNFGNFTMKMENMLVDRNLSMDLVCVLMSLLLSALCFIHTHTHTHAHRHS